MNILILSDIHSNIEALISVFKDAEKHSFDMIFNLGDIIGYGPDPVKCVEFVRDKGMVSIKGNHERMLFNLSLRRYANEIARYAIDWTDENISFQCREFLEGLPEVCRNNDKFLCVHGTPMDPDEYIFRISTAHRAIEKIKEENLNLCFHGHSHIPGVFDDKGNFLYVENEKIDLNGSPHLVNPGSVGQPRDRDPRASYCIYNEREQTVTFYRVEYDILTTFQKIEKAGLPVELGTRLFYGI